MFNRKMKNTIFLLSALFMSQNCLSQDFVLDQTDPKSVVNAIFYAAKSSDFNVLCDLCFPESDGDTRQICNICFDHSDHEFVKGFCAVFSSGKITQSPTYVSEEQVSVEFVFGPEGETKRNETMNLMKFRGKWYLSSF